MGKDIELVAHIHIFPLNDGEMPDGFTEGDKGTSLEDKRFDPNAKEIVLMDPDSGEVIHYKMPGKMVRSIGGQLKMSNKALAAQLKKEADDARARTLLAGGAPGAGPNGALQLTPEQMRQLKDS